MIVYFQRKEIKKFMKKNIGLMMGVLVFLALIGVICALLYKDNNKYMLFHLNTYLSLTN